MAGTTRGHGNFAGLCPASDVRLELAVESRLPPAGRRGRRVAGMDLQELGAGAYPEFVVHSDDFIQG